MKRSILHAKLHGIAVTGADLHYEGSIALDPEQYELAGMVPFEFVEIWNKSSGARISTYIIQGEPGSRCCVLNGAAARTCQPGDELIIAARTDVDDADLARVQPRVVIFGGDNRVSAVHEYTFARTPAGHWRVSARKQRGAAA